MGLKDKEVDPLLTTMKRQLVRSGLRRYLYGALAILLIFLMYRWLSKKSDYTEAELFRMGYRGEMLPTISHPTAGQAPTKTVVGNTVRLEVYMEAQCPDTSRFIHKQLMKAWEKLGTSGRVEWNLIPFGKARCTEKKDGDYECQCQHGANECVLNQLMNCVIEKTTYPEKYIPVVNCIQGERSLEGAIGKCVAGKEGLDETQMRDCASGPRGRRLLALAGARTVALRPALTFVPWIVLDGDRAADALYDLTENICKRLQPAPQGCAEYNK